MEVIKMSEMNAERVRVYNECVSYDLDRLLMDFLISNTIHFIQKHHEYSYIFIFDGLDSVTLDRVQYEHYIMWLNEILSVLNNNQGLFKAVYLITMRDYSFIKFFLDLHKTDRQHFKEHVILRVKKASLYEILSKRFNRVIKLAETENITINRASLWSIKNNLIDIINMALYGMTPKDFDSVYTSNKSNNRKDYDLIQALCNGNYRSVLRFLRQTILILSHLKRYNLYHFLGNGTGYERCLKFFDGNSWAIYRILLFGDCGQCAYRNRVSYDSSGKIITETKHSPLIPNIFNYKDRGIDRKDAMHPRLLLKLRVIQILSSKRDLTMSIYDLEETLIKLHECSSSVIRADIREMIYSGLVNPKVNQTEFIRAESKGTDYPIKLSESATIVIEKMLCQSIYYEIICDDTPIDRYFAHLIKPANKYEDLYSSKKGLGDYLRIKTKSIFMFLFYLTRAEHVINKKWGESVLNEEYQPILTQDIIDKVKYSINEFIFSYYRNLNQEDKDNFKTDWKIEFPI
jgi:hypothetical protein